MAHLHPQRSSNCKFVSIHSFTIEKPDASSALQPLALARFLGYFAGMQRVLVHSLAVHSLALLLAILAGATPAAAAESIASLFGYTLGKTFTAALESPGEPTPEGYLVYRFAPNELADIFPLAQVRVSPATRTIIDIAAAAIVSDGAEAENKFNELKRRLEQRFGKAVHKKLAYNELYVITQKNRKITFFMRLDPLTDERLLYCNAMDLDVFGKARKEIPKVNIR